MSKLWKEMSRVEKGEILLAYHEGQIIEYNPFGRCGVWHQHQEPTFLDQHEYRIRPTPKIREVELYFGQLVQGALVRKHHSDTHKMRISLIDGVPPEGCFTNETGDMIFIRRIEQFWG